MLLNYYYFDDYYYYFHSQNDHESPRRDFQTASYFLVEESIQQTCPKLRQAKQERDFVEEEHKRVIRSDDRDLLNQQLSAEVFQVEVLLHVDEEKQEKKLLMHFHRCNYYYHFLHHLDYCCCCYCCCYSFSILLVYLSFLIIEHLFRQLLLPRFLYSCFGEPQRRPLRWEEAFRVCVDFCSI